MKKIKSLNTYQKSILLFMTAMVLIFTGIYPIVLSRVGFGYRNSIFPLHQENGIDVYSGKLNGKHAVFTVTADKQVIFQYGDLFYGPYTIKKDSSAVSEKIDTFDPELLTGIELREKEQIFFRGAVADFGEHLFIYNEDGTLFDGLIMIEADSDSIMTDESGKLLDPIVPSVYTIINLMKGPELIHKGNVMGWFSGIFICILTTISILFADELFRWNLSFQIQNAEYAEPSDWQIGCRYVTWTILPMLALALFVIGLQ